MTFFKSLPENAGPPNVFKEHPDIYGPFSEMSQALMNGPSTLTQAEREIVLAFAAGVLDCEFVFIGHSEVAYAWGVERGLLDELIHDLNNPKIDDGLKALLKFVLKLAQSPNEMTEDDASNVFRAGWDEKALHDAIAITARAAFMQRLIAGHGFALLDRDVAQSHARKRVEKGYVNLYKTFKKGQDAN
jgi:alkylhydroperoxidase family enzyme